MDLIHTSLKKEIYKYKLSSCISRDERDTLHIETQKKIHSARVRITVEIEMSYSLSVSGLIPFKSSVHRRCVPHSVKVSFRLFTYFSFLEIFQHKIKNCSVCKGRIYLFAIRKLYSKSCSRSICGLLFDIDFFQSA